MRSIISLVALESSAALASVLLIVPICWPWDSTVLWSVAMLDCNCWMIGSCARVEPRACEELLGTVGLPTKP